ncbi:Zn-ribbon domain-containing OB-fold protein [Methanoplanus sp. FWC-SCC4]|uniref:Zn-ribbon domain-containing OB-fold protein n=1 Tax=Methanochimaera problematica TaxID=2609417 RepID=A0AA97FFW7_9EURY|nr:Zn-ribbon domain-containing OB-fold protein [Methanoplanus sp. FWC-SCC4]WOF16716.1 Zn-ribbon domain-containing OB-fold protein [Methanoplanus sp. FWC-SCC4]
MSVPRFWRKQPQRYNLIGTKCETCGTHYFPPRTLCPKCRREGKIVEHKFKGTGKVVTFSIIRTTSEEYDIQTPFPVAIIELDEGTRMTAPVVCDINEIHIGMPVKSTFRKIVSDGPSGTIVYGTKFVPA